VGEAHHPLARAAGADHDHQSEHEHRVGEDRADDRRLGDDQLALLQREYDDEQLGQVAETTQASPASASVASAKLGTDAQAP
jgi:hypothetical protein